MKTSPPPPDPNLLYAKRIAVALWEKHWRDPKIDWKPFDDLFGILSQIDNMASGMVRANLGRDITAELVLAVNRQLTAVRAIRQNFGPPGDYGYNSPQGKAMLELLDAHNALNAAIAKLTAP